MVHPGLRRPDRPAHCRSHSSRLLAQWVRLCGVVRRAGHRVAFPEYEASHRWRCLCWLTYLTGISGIGLFRIRIRNVPRWRRKVSAGQGERWARALLERLSRLYEAAGTPTLESLATYCGLNQQQVSISSLQEWVTGESVPRSATVFRVLVERLETLARRRLGPNHRPTPLDT